MCRQIEMPSEWEYIVVGSGAAGGTVAARLAEAGKTVLLLEPGSDPVRTYGDDPADGHDAPRFHPFTSESDAIQLARNAMISVDPHDAGWDGIAALTGDSSWSAENMHCYFERLENCHHRHVYRRLARLGINPTRHGYDDWPQTERAIPLTALAGSDLRKVLLASITQAIEETEEQARWFLENSLDPSSRRTVEENAIGLRYVPLTTRSHASMGMRERLREVACRNPDRLRIEHNAPITRVLLDDNQRAVGVEYLCHESLHRVHANSNHKRGELRQARATCEVILSVGALNTPQLLMLSGIGPAEGLQRHCIPVKVDLHGVGKNLHDRYEISVVNRINSEKWEIFDGAGFDAQYHRRREKRDGSYNIPVLSLFNHSTEQAPLPDLFCFASLGRFEDDAPGYSDWHAQNLNYLTWTILKPHTHAGEVTLLSPDPRDAPQVNLHLQEGTPDGVEDMSAVVDALRFVRRISNVLIEKGLIAKEELPGRALQSDEELSEYIRENAWGHHASCSCAIGPREQGGVLDSNFRVHGVRGLRVVDASAFPRIPGLFIANAVYMIGEKAADVILEDAKTL